MLSEKILMDNFVATISAMAISVEFQHTIIDCYQDFLDDCPELDMSVLLSMFPSEEHIARMQIAFEAEEGDEIMEFWAQSNMYAICELIAAGFEVAEFTQILYMLEQGMDYSKEDDHRLSSHYLVFSFFLLSVSGLRASSHRIAKADNVVAFKPKQDAKVEEAWDVILDALVDIREGIEPLFVEIITEVQKFALTLDENESALMPQ
jgi:hypothetical protein